jgi:hypothetical protein
MCMCGVWVIVGGRDVIAPARVPGVMVVDGGGVGGDDGLAALRAALYIY